MYILFLYCTSVHTEEMTEINSVSRNSHTIFMFLFIKPIIASIQAEVVEDIYGTPK